MPKKARGTPRNLAAARRGAELAEAAKTELRGEIHRRRLVSAELAQDLGYSRTFLSNLFRNREEKNRSSLRLETFLTLLHLLDIDPGDFFSRLKATSEVPIARSSISNAGASEARPSPGLAAKAAHKARSTTVEAVLRQGLNAETAEELGDAAANLVLGLHRILSLALASSERVER